MINKRVKVKNKEDTIEISFTKTQIVNSKRYRVHRDVLMSLLNDGVRYALTEVEQLLEDFLKKEVIY